VRRKSIIILLLSLISAVFVIAVGAERHSGRIESNQRDTSILPLLPRFVSASVAILLAERQEETDLVLEGSVFLFLGLLSLKRERRTVGRSKTSLLISTARSGQTPTRASV
jgi:hypothetical protein